MTDDIQFFIHSWCVTSVHSGRLSLIACILQARLFQVAETLPAEVLKAMHAPAKPDVPILNPAELADADGIIFGLPTRYGAAPAQIRSLVITHYKTLV
jgi:hypothetical protein